MPEPTIPLSDEARALLLRHATEDDVRIDDTNRETHRELARAGLLRAAHSFRDGPEAFYTLTDTGWIYAQILINPSP